MTIGENFPAKTPEGPIEDKWTSYKNKKKVPKKGKTEKQITRRILQRFA